MAKHFDIESPESQAAAEVADDKALINRAMKPSAAVTYDKYGRMNYHPDFHAKQAMPWTTLDERYLVENYEKIGPEEVSLALERTIHTVMTRAYKLRKQGQMQKATRRIMHRRSGFQLRGSTQTF